MFKCDKLKATDVSVGVYQKKKRKNGQETKKKSSKLKKIRFESGLICNTNLKVPKGSYQIEFPILNGFVRKYP